jgi:hypothetical protein
MLFSNESIPSTPIMLAATQRRFTVNTTHCIYSNGKLIVTLFQTCTGQINPFSTLNQCRKLSCVTVVCKLVASYQGYPNYIWDLISYAKG